MTKKQLDAYIKFALDRLNEGVISREEAIKIISNAINDYFEEGEE